MLDDYSSNLDRCVDAKKRRIRDMKSHDYHVFIETLLHILNNNINNNTNLNLNINNIYNNNNNFLIGLRKYSINYLII